MDEAFLFGLSADAVVSVVAVGGENPIVVGSEDGFDDFSAAAGAGVIDHDALGAEQPGVAIGPVDGSAGFVGMDGGFGLEFGFELIVKALGLLAGLGVESLDGALGDGHLKKPFENADDIMFGDFDLVAQEIGDGLGDGANG